MIHKRLFQLLPSCKSAVFFNFRSRKRKSSLTNGTNGVDHPVHRSDVIAVGTSSGSVLIYSLKTGDISAQFSAEKAHSDRINDIVR
jgi:hypothetical protein